MEKSLSVSKVLTCIEDSIYRVRTDSDPCRWSQTESSVYTHNSSSLYVQLEHNTVYESKVLRKGDPFTFCTFPVQRYRKFTKSRKLNFSVVAALNVFGIHQGHFRHDCIFI
ncbi:Hypothetical predicted protein [Octopus vulgaris]|uniref:Uncharacterized protein n=1 Tax=Octopus vulgaris TaxID=6645 RepID=A0AA36FB84_OCTVU|nr:Hypothetical predicted protein [Octopus vulgaris]